MKTRNYACIFPLSLCATVSGCVGYNYEEFPPDLAASAPDLKFPTSTTDISTVKAPEMALFKPKGQGPFPALVLLHQCGRLFYNEAMLNWAHKALDKGYVVLLLDSFIQRKVMSV